MGDITLLNEKMVWVGCLEWIVGDGVSYVIDRGRMQITADHMSVDLKNSSDMCCLLRSLLWFSFPRITNWWTQSTEGVHRDCCAKPQNLVSSILS